LRLVDADRPAVRELLKVGRGDCVSMNATMPSVRFNATPQTAASPVFHSRAKRGFGPKRNSQQTAWMFHKIDYATFTVISCVIVGAPLVVGADRRLGSNTV
jgi:hypothetical protein